MYDLIFALKIVVFNNGNYYSEEIDINSKLTDVLVKKFVNKAQEFGTQSIDLSYISEDVEEEEGEIEIAGKNNNEIKSLIQEKMTEAVDLNRIKIFFS